MSHAPLHPETLAIRAGKETSDYQEHSQALFLTSSFKSASAAEAAKLFSGEIPGYTYSRFTNPTVSAFQARLAALEEGERAVATASSAPQPWAMSATARMSMISVSGLDGVSR